MNKEQKQQKQRTMDKVREMSEGLSEWGGIFEFGLSLCDAFDALEELRKAIAECGVFVICEDCKVSLASKVISLQGDIADYTKRVLNYAGWVAKLPTEDSEEDSDE